jgi:hypothetical protein
MSQVARRAALLSVALGMILVMPIGTGWADQQNRDHSFSISPDGKSKSKAKAKAKASCTGDCSATTDANTSVVVDPESQCHVDLGKHRHLHRRFVQCCFNQVGAYCQ